jgi:hypothetical protein
MSRQWHEAYAAVCYRKLRRSRKDYRRLGSNFRDFRKRKNRLRKLTVFFSEQEFLQWHLPIAGTGYTPPAESLRNAARIEVWY